MREFSTTLCTDQHSIDDTMSKAQSPYDSLRHIPQHYDTSDSHNSALNLILTLRPEWRDSKDTIEFERFTDGITNTVCMLKTSRRREHGGDFWLSKNSS
jgi:hypothetical protein